MTKPGITPSELIGQLPTDPAWLKQAKARVWLAGLRLWMWKYQPHLRVRPVWNTEVKNEIEHDLSFAVKYKHVYAIPVWNINMEEVAYWDQWTYEGYWLGRVKHLGYLEDAQIRRNSKLASDV